MKEARWWQSPLLCELPHAYHIFGGCGFDIAGIEDVSSLLNRLGLPSKLYMVKQVHSAVVRVGVEELVRGERSVEGDGILLLGESEGGVIFTADCVPVFIVSKRGPWGALLHAGWRGVVGGIVQRGVELLLSRTPAREGELVVACGPAIGPCCFEVGEEVADSFYRLHPGSVLMRSGEKPRVDLKRAIAKILVSCGIPKDNIDMSEICTCCDHGFHSYRRDSVNDRRQISVLFFPPGCTEGE